MKNVYFDQRWIGENGIGRFASEIYKAKISFHDIPLKGNPAAKFDLLKLTAWILTVKGIYFSPGYNSPILALDRTVVTVHDLNHIDIDHNSSFFKKIYYKFVLKRTCQKCLKIITVSEFSKKRIVDWACVPEEKVIVVGNGVSAEFRIDGEKYSPGFKYVFVVGNRKKHKNEARSLVAFLESDIHDDVKIIFSGNPSKELLDIVKKYNSSERVLFAGRLSNEELANYYRGAEFSLFVSLYEGFGLPVIESMACGVPVITSNTTSLKEVAGDAAYLVNPESQEEIQFAISKLFIDNSLRDKLITKGIYQASKYSWEKTIYLIENSLYKVIK